jgi:hypothetical protein
VREVVCLDRLPHGRDPVAWLLSELGRPDGPASTAPAPAAARLLVAVPLAAVVVGFRRLGRGASVGRAATLGVLAGAVFAVLITAIALAGSLWLTTGTDAVSRTVAIGPEPVSTAVLAAAWGIGGGAMVAGGSAWWLSRRARPR